MRRLLGSVVVGLLTLGFPALTVAAHGQPPDQLVRESFVDYPREHPGATVKPPGAGGGGRTCVLPASDLCTDFKDGRFRWADPSVDYAVNTSGGPSGTLAAVKAAFDVWENETKSAGVAAIYGGDASALDFTYVGGSSVAGATLDGTNVVSYADLSTSCRGCLAVTTYWYWLGTRQLAEFDITLNTEYPWTTSGASDAYDVENVVTHEAGHTLVLGDLYKGTDGALTMYGYAGLGETAKRDLGAGDVLGLRKAYPAS